MESHRQHHEKPEGKDSSPPSPLKTNAAALAMSIAIAAAIAACQKTPAYQHGNIPNVHNTNADQCSAEDFPPEIMDLVFKNCLQRLVFELRPDMIVTEETGGEIDPSNLKIVNYLGKPLLTLTLPNNKIYIPIQGWELPKDAIGKDVRFGLAPKMRFLQQSSHTRPIGLQSASVASNGKRIHIPEKDIILIPDPETGKTYVYFRIGENFWFKSVADLKNIDADLENGCRDHFFVANFDPLLEPLTPKERKRRKYRPANSPTIMPHSGLKPPRPYAPPPEPAPPETTTIPAPQPEAAPPKPTAQPPVTPEAATTPAPQPEITPPPKPTAQPPVTPEAATTPAPQPEITPPPEPTAQPPVTPEPPMYLEKILFTLTIEFSPEGVPGKIFITPPSGWESPRLQKEASPDGTTNYLLILENPSLEETATIDITPHMINLLTTRDPNPLRLESTISTKKNPDQKPKPPQPGSSIKKVGPGYISCDVEKRSKGSEEEARLNPQLRSDMQTFFSEIKEASTNKLILMDISAWWCGPCKFVAPFLIEAAEKMQQAGIRAEIRNLELGGFREYPNRDLIRAFLAEITGDPSEADRIMADITLPKFLLIRNGHLIKIVDGFNFLEKGGTLSANTIIATLKPYTP